MRGEDGPDVYPVAASGYPETPPSSMRESMSALAAFPYVYACAEARADDLALLPITVERQTGGGWEKVNNDPLTALLARPTRTDRIGSVEMRRQIYIDFALSNNAYLWLDSERSPRVVRRVHPEEVRVELDQVGLPVRYDIGTDRREVYSVDRMIHIAGATWGNRPGESAYGLSPVQVLKRGLETELAIMDGMRRQSKLSRPDGVLSPPDGVEWTPSQAKKLGTELRQWQTGKGGMLLNPWGARVDLIGHSPREMEYAAGLDRITAQVLAVMGVPPTRVGLQSANYATAQQEAIRNWEKRQGEAALIDEAFTRLLRRFPGYEDARAFHDFGGVDALQYARTQKLDRVSLHIANGMPAADAYRVEGMDTAASAMEKAPSQQPAEPVPQTDEGARHLRAALEALEAIEDGRAMPEDVADVRATIRAALSPRRAS